MFHRSVLLFVIALLTVSGGAAWAFDVFVNINAKSAISGSDLSAYPTGVSAGGACVLQGAGQQRQLLRRVLLFGQRDRNHDQHGCRVHVTVRPRSDAQWEAR